MSIRKQKQKQKLKQLAGGLFLTTAMLMPSMWARAEDPAKQPTKAFVPPRLLQTVWIGVLCRPADKSLRTHLNLEHGLLVTHVATESPAGKAGIQQHDILLEFGDAKLTSRDDLLSAVRKNKDQQAAVKLVRAGEEKTIQLTSGKRPGVGVDLFIGPGVKADDLTGWIEDLQSQFQNRVPFRLRSFGPGVVVSGRLFKEPPFPKDLGIAITKEGDQPAKIVVKQGDKSWEVTDKELDKLSDDVRPHVQRLLGRGAPFFHLDGLPQFDFSMDGPLFQGRRPNRSGPLRVERRENRQERHGGFDKRLERKLDQVQRSLEKLQDELEQLREDRSGKSDK